MVEQPMAYVVLAFLGIQMGSFETVPLSHCEDMAKMDNRVMCVVAEPDCGGIAPACKGRADLEPRTRTVRRKR